MSAADPALPRALIFDVDGTLAETEEAHRSAFNQTFAAAGLAWHWDTDLYRDLLRVTGGQQRIRHHASRIGHALADDAVAALHRAKNRRYAEMVAGGAVSLRPGVARLIAEARQAGLRLAIATTTSRSNLEALLAHVMAPEALAWFEVIVTGEDVFAKKPDPEAYARALAGLGLAATECFAFEDSRNGLLAAHALAIPTVVTPSVYTAHEVFAEAMLVLRSFDDPVRLDVAALRTLAAPIGRAQASVV